MQLRKWVATLLAVVVLLSIVNVGAVTATPALTLADGEYPINYKYLSDDSNNPSMVQDYVVPGTGKLIVKNGEIVFQNTFANYDFFKFFGLLEQGKVKSKPYDYEDAINYSLENYIPRDYIAVTNVEGGTGTVQLPIANLSEKQEILMHIIVPAISYNNWYNAQLVLNTEGLPFVTPGDGNGGVTTPTTNKAKLLELLNQSNDLYNNAQTFNPSITSSTARAVGEYPIAVKDELMEKGINPAKAVYDNELATQENIDLAWNTLQSQLSTFKSEAIVILDEINISYLDAIAPVAELSSDQANYFGDKAVVLKSGNKLYVNLTIANNSGVVLESVYYYPTNANGNLLFSQANLTLDEVSSSQGENGEYVGQLILNRSNTALTSGIIPVHFKLTGSDDDKVMYINFNAVEQSLLVSTLEAAQTLHDQAVEGSLLGQYAAGAKTAVAAVIASSSAVSDNAAATKSALKAATDALQTAVNQFKESQVSELVDGNYTVDFKILKFGTEQDSVMQSYVVSPGLLKVSGDTKKLFFTVKQDKEITGLKFNGQPVQVASQDVTNNTRIVYLEIPSLSEKLEGWVKIDWPELSYFHEYDVQLKIDETSLKSTTDNIEEPEAPVEIDASALQALLSTAQAAYVNAVEGNEAGNYKVGSKAIFADAITGAVNAADAKASQYAIDMATSYLEQAFDVFKASKNFSNGNYSVEFKATNSDFVKHMDTAGGLSTKDGTYTLSFTPKAGVAVKKLVNEKTEVVILPVGTTPAPQGFALAYARTTALFAVASPFAAAAVTGATPVQFQVTDLSAPYSVVLDVTENDVTEEVSYRLQFANITLANDTTPDPGTGTGTDVTPDTGLANGQYNINVRIVKYGTDQNSVMQDYIVPTAKLRVASGSNRIYLTLKQDKQITGLKFNGANVSVESRNAEKNTRVVSFPVPDLSKVLDGWVKIDWPEMDYFHEYDIQMKFNTSSISPSADILVPDDVVEEVKEEEDNASVVSFKDIESHWAKSAIVKAVGLGIVKGYEDGNFRPNGVITRSEFAVLISRALKLPESATATAFDDGNLIPAWAKTAVQSAVAAGLVGGYDDQTFRGSRQITRAELAVIIVRAAKLETKEDATLSFADASAVPAWAQKEVAAAVEAGFINGKGNNLFDPNANATRAEALTLVMKLLEEK
ncbi:NEAT domain-containing protein [Paenibacillus sinopodophylli]|uniref:NEAT domain-containing protein n=1 Tax=Paenibacillus sinopodophylli TaxID=1837342 RepID=UPI001FE2CDAA|nr:NEAT domain-containing protein [Paenibacillus sinopodophylli]